jgi:hypothetical protein
LICQDPAWSARSSDCDGPPYGLATGLLFANAPEGFQSSPLEVLRDRARVRLGRLEWEIEILPSALEVARALGITSGVLVVASRATAYSRDGVPVSRSERRDRVDRVKFHVAAQDPADATGGETRPTKGRVLRSPDAMR